MTNCYDFWLFPYGLFQGIRERWGQLQTLIRTPLWGFSYNPECKILLVLNTPLLFQLHGGNKKLHVKANKEKKIQKCTLPVESSIIYTSGSKPTSITSHPTMSSVVGHNSVVRNDLLVAFRCLFWGALAGNTLYWPPYSSEWSTKRPQATSGQTVECLQKLEESLRCFSRSF